MASANIETRSCKSIVGAMPFRYVNPSAPPLPMAVPVDDEERGRRCAFFDVAFDAEASILGEARAAAELLRDLYARITIVRHKRSTGVALPSSLADVHLSTEALEALKHREAALQFGTLGRGNHFLKFQAWFRLF